MEVNWQPIETAPKGDAWILAYAPEEGGQVYVATWEPTSWNREPQWVYGACGDYGFRTSINPTHWMPLPSPPK